MKMPMKYLTIVVLASVLALPAWATTADEARVTIECRGHAITVSMVEFWLDDNMIYQDNAPGLACTAGNGDTKLYQFVPPLDINAFEFWFVCDGGALTMMHIPPELFYFHIPIKLPCPSPGGVVAMDLTPPTETDAMLIVSDHDVLTWPSSECFRFRGGIYDYVCVTWFCDAPYEPVFHIYPGCSDPCGDPNCTPAQYLGIAWSAPCNPVPNIWCRLFWPIGLSQPGCWCYFFEFQLAVELASFDAVPVDNGIRLRFTTASEQDNGFFEVWRGTSATGPFERVTRIPSFGNTATGHSYEYTDGSVTPGTAYWYYLADEDLQGHRIEHRDRMVQATANATLLPEEYSLTAYPNPFNPVTTLAFSLPAGDRVELKVYDVAGRLVQTLASGFFTAGTHSVAFDAANLPSGIYLAKIESGSFTASRKLLLIK